MKMGALKCVSPIVNNVKLKAENVEQKNNFTEVIGKGRTAFAFEVIAKTVAASVRLDSGVFREVFWLSFGESLLPDRLQGLRGVGDTWNVGFYYEVYIISRIQGWKIRNLEEYFENEQI